MAIGFGCLAVGMVAFAGGNGLTVVVGVAAISVGSAVLFLKNDLEALARSRRSATIVFGQQRLAVLLPVLGLAVERWPRRRAPTPGLS